MSDLFTGLSISTKICSKCGLEKPATDRYFPTNQAKCNSLRTVCKVCNTSLQKERSIIKKRTPPAPIDHRCPICDRTQDDLTKPWELDHIHGTTYFRDWICQDCNLGLGKFNDDPLTVIRAAEYLVKHEIKSNKPTILNPNIFGEDNG